MRHRHQIIIPFDGGDAYIERRPQWEECLEGTEHTEHRQSCTEPSPPGVREMYISLDDGQTQATRLDTVNRVFVDPVPTELMEADEAQALAAALCDELLTREAEERQRHERDILEGSEEPCREDHRDRDRDHDHDHDHDASIGSKTDDMNAFRAWHRSGKREEP